MSSAFDAGRFELVDTDRVHVAGHRFGRGRRGELDVWVEEGAAGTRFSRQITAGGGTNAARHGVYTDACYFLRERSTGRYYFLEADGRGFFLYGDDFFGAQAFLGRQAGAVAGWLAQNAPQSPAAPGRDAAPAAGARDPTTAPPPGASDTAARPAPGGAGGRDRPQS
jgi:hypothetical protein